MPLRMSDASTLDSQYQPRGLPMKRRHIHYAGRVQGVGFRYTVKNIAMRFNVSGYVRNLTDGRVELILEGPADEIEQLSQAVQEKMSGYIRGVETESPPATGEFSHFHIRH
jgi:acylphosphatase